jgi:hypothetical protein
LRCEIPLHFCVIPFNDLAVPSPGGIAMNRFARMSRTIALAAAALAVGIAGVCAGGTDTAARGQGHVIGAVGAAGTSCPTRLDGFSWG